MLRAVTLTMLAVLAAPVGGLAAPGDLDTTFNGTGKVVTAIANGGAQATSLVRQSDGKLVAAGYVNVPVVGNQDNLDFAIIRYDVNGTPDASFGGTGTVTTAVRNGDDQIEALIQQTDGKLLAAGTSYDGPFFIDSAITLVRYLDNGTLDPAFGGGDGIVILTPNMDYDAGLALIQQADEKLVVAGSSGADVVVVRLNLDGTPDLSFNGTGRVTTPIGTLSTAIALLQQADLKLVVAGSSDANIALARYDTVGMLDSMFDGDGIVVTPVGTDVAEARALIQQAGDGKLVVAGVSSNATNTDLTLVRYATNGGVDTGFGTLGFAITPIGSGDDEGAALAQQDDGALVAAGWSHNGTNRDIAVVRYVIGGTPDPDFGAAGIVTTAIGTGDDEAAALVIQPNGGIVVAGYSRSGSVRSFALARYLSLTGTTTSSSTTTTTSTTVPTTTATSTSSTSTTVTTGPTTTNGPTTTVPGGSTTTSTTLAVVRLVPGGPAAKTSDDCYLELRVRGITASQVQKNRVVSCTDGDPCDQGPCGDDRCDVEIAACAGQTDPALPGCTPPASLDTVKIGGALAGSTGGLLAGPACSSSTQVQVAVKFTKRGTYRAGKSKLVLKGNAKAPKGTSPRKDKDKWTIQCVPRSGACAQ